MLEMLGGPDCSTPRSSTLGALTFMSVKTFAFVVAACALAACLPVHSEELYVVNPSITEISAFSLSTGRYEGALIRDEFNGFDRFHNFVVDMQYYTESDTPRFALTYVQSLPDTLAPYRMWGTTTFNPATHSMFFKTGSDAFTVNTTMNVSPSGRLMTTDYYMHDLVIYGPGLETDQFNPPSLVGYYRSSSYADNDVWPMKSLGFAEPTEGQFLFVSSNTVDVFHPFQTTKLPWWNDWTDVDLRLNRQIPLASLGIADAVQFAAKDNFIVLATVDGGLYQVDLAGGSTPHTLIDPHSGVLESAKSLAISDEGYVLVLDGSGKIVKATLDAHPVVSTLVTDPLLKGATDLQIAPHFALLPVPEPEVYSLALGGLAVVVARRRRPAKCH